MVAKRLAPGGKRSLKRHPPATRRKAAGQDAKERAGPVWIAAQPIGVLPKSEAPPPTRRKRHGSWMVGRGTQAPVTRWGVRQTAEPRIGIPQSATGLWPLRGTGGFTLYCGHTRISPDRGIPKPVRVKARSVRATGHPFTADAAPGHGRSTRRDGSCRGQAKTDTQLSGTCLGLVLHLTDAAGGSFSLDANARIEAHDRHGLECLLRHCAHPSPPNGWKNSTHSS